jgi:very-short-patch-repair endonuclease
MAYLGKTTPDILHHGASAETHNLAVILRKSETEAEKLLWQVLKNRKCAGLKFRRQHPFGRFVLDFYCHERALAVEVDGCIHKNRDVKERDLNPTNNMVTLVREEILPIQNITITKQTGFVLEQNIPVNNFEFTYNLQNQPPGTYLFYITTNAGTSCKVINKL